MTTEAPAKAAEQNGATTVKRNLYQKILDVSAEVGAIQATGKNFAGGKALSIEDVEEAVSKHLINHSVLVRFRNRSIEKIDKDWKAEVTAVVTNADDPSEFFEDDWADTGGNPAAAYSYARKSYLKALLPLATAEDEGPNPAVSQGGAARAQSTPTAASPTRKADVLGPCTLCIEEGLQANGGKTPALFRNLKTGRVSCNGKREDGSYANHGPLSETAEVDLSEIPF